ncbi:MAG TPA: diaminopimelate epimerase [Armatimonadota bacterium]|nr:diaminopimelate epimerase [Armatimonadota bacterium]
MQFAKMHGLGNDFVMVNGFTEIIPETDLGETSRKLCDRHFGIGGDGLILALPSARALFRMRMFNPDGSEAEMCGNGIRCFAAFVRSRGLTREAVIPVETLAGIITPELISDSKDGPLVQVDMGRPRFARSEIPVLGDEDEAIAASLTLDGEPYEFTAVSMGNPHCVILVDDVRSFPVTTKGPQIEKLSLFPRRTNVEFVQVISNSSDLSRARMRVWERGAGETLACGTGACAAAVACAVNRRTGRKVAMELNGGQLLIEWTDDDRVLMTGPAVEVFTGDVDPARLG